MKISNRLLLAACLVLPFLGACKKEDAAQSAVKAPVTMPATATDENAWNAYLTDVVTRNLELFMSEIKPALDELVDYEDDGEPDVVVTTAG